MENGNFTNGPENFNNNNGYNGAENYGAGNYTGNYAGNYAGNYDPMYAAPAEAPAEPPKKKKKGCLIAAIVVIVVGIILGIVGVVFAFVFGFIFLGGDKGVSNEEYAETTIEAWEYAETTTEDNYDYDWDYDNDYDWYTDDDYIDMIKNAKNSTYGITYGDAFESFFTDPTWSYFESIDYEDVVEFEGGLLYNNEPVTALIQFVLDVDAGTFEIHYLSFDDETQDEIMLEALIEKVFEEY